MVYPSDHNRRFCYRTVVSHRVHRCDRKHNSIIYGGASGPVRPLLGRNSPVNAVLALSYRIVYANPVGPRFLTVSSAYYIASIDVIEKKSKYNYLRRLRSGVVRPTGCRQILAGNAVAFTSIPIRQIYICAGVGVQKSNLRKATRRIQNRKGKSEQKKKEQL